MLKKVISTLGILPYISCKGIIFVEGETDIKFFQKLNEKFDCLRNIFNIETITLISLSGGGNVKRWIAESYLEDTNIKGLFFIDRDKKQEEEERNKKVIITEKREIENYFPINVLEEYFSEKLGIENIFSKEATNNWDNEDIAKVIYNKQIDKTIKEKDIKNMFYDKKIWDKINKNNMQGFNEIERWFENIRGIFFED